MLNWFSIFAHLLWILGLTLLLSSMSLAHWRALEQHRPFRQLILDPFFNLAIISGFGLFALGLTLTVEPWWYKLGWLSLTAVSVWQGVAAWRRVM